MVGSVQYLSKENYYHFNTQDLIVYLRGNDEKKST